MPTGISFDKGKTFKAVRPSPSDVPLGSGLAAGAARALSRMRKGQSTDSNN